MCENNTLQINQKEFKDILLNYYRTFYNDNSISIDFNPTKKYVGIYDVTELVTKIILKRNIQIGNYKATMESIIEESDIEKILNEELNEQGYEVSDIFLKTQSVAHGIYETEEIVFNGVTIELKSKSKQKKI